MAEREAAIKYVVDNKKPALDRLVGLSKIRSVSDWPDHHPQVLECANAAKAEMDKSGLENTKLIFLKDKPDVPPCVYGEYIKHKDQPTVLLYAHYDVQPPGRDDAWRTPTWEPTTVDMPEIGGERMYGRGVADDKAGLIAHLMSVEAVLKTTKSLPVNVKVLFEGEEELGSIHLEEFLAANLDLLKSDILILADTGNFDIGVPSITYSLRGICQLDVELRTVKAAVHSGMWGGPLVDSLTAMCKLLGTMHDDKGELVIDGIYDGVRKPTEKEKANMLSLNYTEEKFRKESGLLDGVKVTGDPNATILEKIWLKPAISVIGLDSCEINKSANKILPYATARISVRIVADQDPDHVLKVLKAHLTKHAPFGAQVSFSKEEGTKAWVCVPEGPVFEAAERAIKLGYGSPSVLVGCGGTIGFVEPFAKAFGGAPAILVGVEDPYTNAHGENESLCITDWVSSIKSIVHLLFELKK